MELIKRFWSFLINLLSNEIGAVGDLDDDDPGDDNDIDTGTLDDSDNDDSEDDEGDFLIDLKDDEGKKSSKKDKDKDKGDDGLSAEIKSLKDEIEQLKETKKSLNTALHQARQDKKKPDDKSGDTSPLTKAQLRQILADNKDDEDTLLDIVEYMAQQAARGASKDAVNATEIKKTKVELDEYISEKFPSLSDPGTGMREEIDQTKGKLALGDHPFGDYLAIAARVLDDLPTLIEDAKKEGAAGKTNIEGKRKETIKDNLTPDAKKKKGDKDQHGLTGSQLEAAKQMGLKGGALKTYEMLVGKSKKPRVISVEE